MIGYILTCKENHLYSLTSRSFGLSLPYKSVSRHINIFQSDPDFITSLVGWSVIIDCQLVISLFQQLMVTQLRIMEWHPSLTARQTVNVFALTHIALPSPDDTKQKIMYRLTLHGELKSVRDYFPKIYSRFMVTHWRSQDKTKITNCSHIYKKKL